MPKGGKLLLVLILGLVVAFLHESLSIAQSSSSSNYRIDESNIGPGGNIQSSSNSYSLEAAQQAVGSGAGVGTSGSTNFQTVAGAVTPSEPTLRCVMNSSSISFGSLSTAATSTGTATFSVLNYTSYGYNVSIIGATPVNNGHNLTNLASNTASATGNEQFGINLVANTSPATFGANPVQVPSSTFSNGAAATNYNTSNSYRYVSGETIATAGQSSGQTDYTISYIINASNTTPGGSYSGNQVIVCTGSY